MIPTNKQKEIYEPLHVSSYDCVANDLEDILKSKGVSTK